MKNSIYVLFFSLLLSGCSQKIDYASIQKYQNEIQTNMESFNVVNYPQFNKDTIEFDQQLKHIKTDDKNVRKFVKYQLKANELRREGIKESDSNKITESAKYQYYVEGLFNQIKVAK